MSPRPFSSTAISILLICLVAIQANSFATVNPSSSIASETMPKVDAELDVASDADSEIDAEISEIAVDTVDENIEITTKEINTIASSSNDLTEDVEVASLTEETGLIYDKIDALEPTLLINGKFDKGYSRKNKVELKGQIIPERHPIGRRRFIYRWILKLQDGSRIPLKSNLKLLQKVKDDDVLDGFVSIKGVWLVSPSNENLKFFKIDSMRVIDEPALIEESSNENNAIDINDEDETFGKSEATIAGKHDAETANASASKAIPSDEILEHKESIEQKEPNEIKKTIENNETIKNKKIMDIKEHIGNKVASETERAL